MDEDDADDLPPQQAADWSPTNDSSGNDDSSQAPPPALDASYFAPQPAVTMTARPWSAMAPPSTAVVDDPAQDGAPPAGSGRTGKIFGEDIARRGLAYYTTLPERTPSGGGDANGGAGSQGDALAGPFYNVGITRAPRQFSFDAPMAQDGGTEASNGAPTGFMPALIAVPPAGAAGGSTLGERRYSDGPGGSIPQLRDRSSGSVAGGDPAQGTEMDVTDSDDDSGGDASSAPAPGATNSIPESLRLPGIDHPDFPPGQNPAMSAAPQGPKAYGVDASGNLQWKDGAMEQGVQQAAADGVLGADDAQRLLPVARQRDWTAQAIADAQAGNKPYTITSDGRIFNSPGRPLDALTAAVQDGVMENPPDAQWKAAAEAQKVIQSSGLNVPETWPSQEQIQQSIDQAKNGQKTYSINGAGQMQFKDGARASGLQQAVQDGVIAPEPAARMLPLAQQADAKYADLVKAAGADPKLKAFIISGLKSSLSMEAGEALSTGVGAVSDAWLAGVGGAITSETGGWGAIVLPLIVHGITFFTGQYAADKALKAIQAKLADYSDTVKSLDASEQLEPGAATVGSLVGGARQALSSVAKLAQLGTTEAAGVAARAISSGVDEATAAAQGQRAAAKLVGTRVGIGAATGAGFEAMLRPAFDGLLNTAANAAGISHEEFQSPTVKSVLLSAALGSALSGEGITSKNYDTAQLAEIMGKSAQAQQLGIPIEHVLSASEIEALQEVGPKLAQIMHDGGGSVIKDPAAFQLRVRQMLTAPDRPAGQAALQKAYAAQEAAWSPLQRSVVESVRRGDDFNKVGEAIGKTPAEVQQIYGQATTLPGVTGAISSTIEGLSPNRARANIGGSEGGSSLPSTPAAGGGQSGKPDAAPSQPTAPPAPADPGPVPGLGDAVSGQSPDPEGWGNIAPEHRGQPVVTRDGISGTLRDVGQRKAALQDATGRYHAIPIADVRRVYVPPEEAGMAAPPGVGDSFAGTPAAPPTVQDPATSGPPPSAETPDPVDTAAPPAPTAPPVPLEVPGLGAPQWGALSQHDVGGQVETRDGRMGTLQQVGLKHAFFIDTTGQLQVAPIGDVRTLAPSSMPSGTPLSTNGIGEGQTTFPTLAAAVDHFANRFGVKQVLAVAPDPETWGAILAPSERLAHLAKIAAEWERLGQAFPGLPKGVVHTLYAVNSPRGRSTLDGPAPRFATKAEEWPANEWAKIEDWEKKYGLKWSVERRGSQVSDNFRHEMAHVLSTPATMQGWSQLVQKQGLEWFRHAVSNYAAKNPKEALAETFSLLTRADYIRGTLPMDLEKFIFHTILGS